MKDVFIVWIVLCNIFQNFVVLQPMTPFVRHGDVNPFDSFGLFGEVLAHYVSGYVTKAEKSHLQDIWQEVSDTKSVYSKLWSFGIRSLRSRECGLYEASDLLLGDSHFSSSSHMAWQVRQPSLLCSLGSQATF